MVASMYAVVIDIIFFVFVPYCQLLVSGNFEFDLSSFFKYHKLLEPNVLFFTLIMNFRG